MISWNYKQRDRQNMEICKKTKEETGWRKNGYSSALKKIVVKDKTSRKTVSKTVDLVVDGEEDTTPYHWLFLYIAYQINL